MWPPNTKFLIVDDMMTMRKMVKKALTEIGYSDIVEGKDGMDAWKQIEAMVSRNQLVDFIISDWNMPNLKGIDLLRNVRSNPATKQLPFILLTAETEKAQVIEAAQAGVNDYIIKPFKKEELAEKLARVYAKKKAA